MRWMRIVPACAALIGLSACAPEYKLMHFSQADWSGSALTGHGKMVVADSVAGAAPNTITFLEIGALESAPSDPSQRLKVQEERARTLSEALERRGVGPATIAIEARPVEVPDPIYGPAYIGKPPAAPMTIIYRY
jgi:hypothetical protein